MAISQKRLETMFPGKGAELRQALTSYSYCENHPAGAARIAECYHPPKPHDVRMHVLDAILGTHGVEYVSRSADSFYSPKGLEYCNAGDSYATTIVYNHLTETYQIGSWADYVERWPNRYV